MFNIKRRFKTKFTKKTPCCNRDKNIKNLIIDYIAIIELKRELNELFYSFLQGNREFILNEIDMIVFENTKRDTYDEKENQERLDRFFVKVCRAKDFIIEKEKEILEEIKSIDSELYRNIKFYNKNRMKKFHMYFDREAIEYYPIPTFLFSEDDLNNKDIKEFGVFTDYAAAIFNSFVTLKVIK